MSATLLNTNIIITRPSKQGQELGQKIQNLQGNPVFFPTLEIADIQNQKLMTNIFSQINAFDFIIFTSQNAVHAVREYLKRIPSSKKIATVGSATAQLLQDLGVSEVLFPKDQFDSEHLLALSEFKDVKDKRILIVTGQGGRDYLKNNLSKAGAMVTMFPVYQRLLPSITNEQITKLTQLNNAIVITTSRENLQNLMTLTNQYQVQNWLLKVPIIIISPRMQDFALSHGLSSKQLILAKNATDEAILESLIKWYS